MWCGCSTSFGDEPNTNVCAVCTGQPGALPVVNEQAVRDATLLGLALNGEIAAVCRFHRKNYFYPDLAKNYQISQYDVPLVHDGWLDVEVPTGDGGSVTRGCASSACTWRRTPESRCTWATPAASTAPTAR